LCFQAELSIGLRAALADEEPFGLMHATTNQHKSDLILGRTNLSRIHGGDLDADPGDFPMRDLE
jgi:hypothetical protein